MPPPGDRVVVVDGTDGFQWILGIRGLRVVDDGMLHQLIFLGPPFAVFLKAVRLIGAPIGARQKSRRRGHVVRGLRRNRDWKVANGRPETGIDEGEGQSRDDRWIALGVDGAISDRSALLSADQ